MASETLARTVGVLLAKEVKGIKVVRQDEIKDWIRAQSGWSYKDKSIRKEYDFPSFRDSIVFVNRIASIADDVDHHPDIDVRYNKVLLTITTHDSGGVTENDLALAEKLAVSGAAASQQVEEHQEQG